jgi:hypothetical protein
MTEEASLPDPASGPTVGLAEADSDSVSADVVRNSLAAGFEQDNLDVPAFLRKRGEIM